jgi:hypothetical protein
MPANEQRIIQAISKLGNRVTAADVVHETGEPLAAVQFELNKLAANTDCALEVSKAGAVVYAFDPQFERILRMRIFTRKVLWILNGLWLKAKYLFRISFGIDLIISIAISAVIVAFLILRSADSWTFSGGGGSGKGKKKRKASDLPAKSKMSAEYLWQQCSLFLFGDPNDRSKKGYLEQCFVFLFAEPDPNRNRFDRQWGSI